ncbi:MAG: hypothetical protein PUF16_04650 [Lachnospiraceae bacterium]|nr:hypothetical protein [Lachnospiraceae bacterium]
MDKQSMDLDELRETLKHTKIPILVLDQKWHRLFALEGKPDDIKKVEVQVNEILKEQGKLNNEVRELKIVKKKLMKNIVDNMDDPHAAKKTHMANVGDMIDETNEKIAADEDRLLEIPKELKEANDHLMILTAKYSYDRMRTNTDEIKEIADWIKQIRVELKKNIIKKQNREINNREIYSYMHDIFGKEMLGLFDIKADTQLILTSKDSYMADVQPNDDDEGTKGEWRSGEEKEKLSFNRKKTDENVPEEEKKVPADGQNGEKKEEGDTENERADDTEGGGDKGSASEEDS